MLSDSKDVKITIKNNNISWDNRIENNVKKIGEKSTGYKIMHIKASINVSKTYNFLMYCGIILGPLSALLSGIGISLYPDSEVTFPIISSCVSFLSGIIVAISKFAKLEEKGSSHKLAASKYTSLESNVRRQLALCRDDRIKAGQYLDWVGNSFDELFLASPLITTKIYNNYIKIAKKHNISIPDEYGIDININEGYQQDKVKEMTNSEKINVNEETTPLKIEQIKPIEKKPIGNTSIKRTKTFSHYPELNKFSDSQMEYEMQRMLGFK